MKLEYRFTGHEDAPALAAMNKHLIEDEGHDNPMSVSELTGRMRRWLQRDEYTGIMFYSGGTVIGYVLYRTEEKYVYVRHFFVMRESRRMGRGREMMRILRERVLPQRRITLEVLVHNQRARKFYEAVGFRDYALIMEALPQV